MATSQILLEARAIGRRTAGTNRWLLRDVSLAVQSGERVAVVGPTGAGKTLLLRSLTMLDPVDRGQIWWRGEPVAPRWVPKFRRQATYLHQRPALVEGTVEDNLRLPYSFAVHAGELFDRGSVLNLLAAVGRGDEFLDRAWRDLSGGESQIVAMVRALQLEPTMLLLDEPTASLDAATTTTIEHLMAHWHQRVPRERATVWVTHDRAQAARLSDRIVEMRDGQLFAGG